MHKSWLHILCTNQKLHTVDLSTRQHLVIQSSKTDIVVKSNMILETQSKGFIQSKSA